MTLASDGASTRRCEQLAHENVKIDRSNTAATFCLAILALAAAGCAGGAAREARQLGQLSILGKTRPLQQNRVTASELESASDGAGVRTLLTFWRTLQDGGYESAAGYFVPRFAKSAGTAKVVAALRNEAPLWDSTKPHIVAASARAGTANVFFAIRDLAGTVVGVEIVFRQFTETWKISFFSLLQSAPSGYTAPLES